MLLPLVTAVAVFGLLSLPGWILAADRPRPLWFHVAAGFCSQFAIILVVAAVALAMPTQIDVRLTLVVAVALSFLVYWHRRGSIWTWPARPDGWIFVVPVVVVLVAALITRAAVMFTPDNLIVRAWFNADGFKHLGHVQSVLTLGLPARDIFGAGEPLSYYWFFYVIPATGAALHGNAAEGLVASGLVQSFGFWILVLGLLRSAGANARWATLLTLVAWLSPTPDGIVGLATNGWDLGTVATQVNIEGIGVGFLNASSLFRLSLYIPQHQLMLAGLLSWAVLTVSAREVLTPGLRVLAVVPLIGAGATSTLFGISCLGVFAATRLVDRREGWLRRIAGIGSVGLLALAVPLVFGVVDATGGNGLDSPIFVNRLPDLSPAWRFSYAIPGLLLAYGGYLVGLAGLVLGFFNRRGLTENARNTLDFAFALVGVGLAILLGSTLLGNARLAQEIQLRTSLLPHVGLAIGTVWLLSGTTDGRQRLSGIWRAIIAPLLVVGMATPILDCVWHVASARWRWTVAVPTDDLVVLESLRKKSPADSVVLQYPEMPFVSGGRDVWTPLFAARMVYASYRSTHWAAQLDKIKQAQAFFDGMGPMPSGKYDFVYLSRTLHPQSYDALVADMAGEPGWSKSACLTDACLWQRN